MERRRQVPTRGLLRFLTAAGSLASYKQVALPAPRHLVSGTRDAEKKHQLAAPCRVVDQVTVLQPVGRLDGKKVFTEVAGRH